MATLFIFAKVVQQTLVTVVKGANTKDIDRCLCQTDSNCMVASKGVAERENPTSTQVFFFQPSLDPLLPYMVI
jgi:hypothetical protein